MKNNYQFKGTKGEWRREDTEHYAEIATNDNPRLAMVANIYDANLIAAAPDLLQACIDMAEWLHDTDPHRAPIINTIHKALGL